MFLGKGHKEANDMSFFGGISRILGGGARGMGQSQPMPNQMAKDPITKRVAPTIGGGILEQYGIYTPEQKRAMQTQQEQQAQQQQQLMDMYQAQLNPAQSANLMAIQGGRQAGQSVGTAAKGFLANHGMAGLQPTDAPGYQPPDTGQGGGGSAGGGAQSDPQAMFTQFLQESGGDVPKAKAKLGMALIQSPDPQYQQAGQQLLADAQKEMLANQKDQASINRDTSQTDQNKASTKNLESEIKDREHGEPKDGEIQTVWTQRGAIQQRYSRDSHSWHEVGRGDRAPKQTIEQGTPEDFRTKSQHGEDQQRYYELQEQGRQITRALDKYDETLKKDGASAGLAGGVILLGQNAIDTAKSVAQTITGNSQMEVPDAGKFDWGKFGGVARDAAFNKAHVMDAAYAYANVLYGQSGKNATDKDIQRTLDRMGAAYSNPNLTREMIADMKQAVKDRVNDYADIRKFEKDPYFASGKPKESPKAPSEMSDEELKKKLGF